MHPKHNNLRRLEDLWVSNPIVFVTTCTSGRAKRLASDEFHVIAVEVWKNCEELSGWSTGQYVIMPDHVHFFASHVRGERTLSDFVGKWKEWTAKYAARRMGLTPPLWQPDFFDHVLRTSESYEQKWQYVRDNPVRAGLVTTAEDWPFQGVLHELTMG